MFTNPFSMVVAIVLIVTAAKMFATMLEHGKARGRDYQGTALPAAVDSVEAQRLRDDVRQLKDRIAVLERLATDGRAARDLATEIEDLRGK